MADEVVVIYTAPTGERRVVRRAVKPIPITSALRVEIGLATEASAEAMADIALAWQEPSVTGAERQPPEAA